MPRKLSFGELRVGRGTHEDLHRAFPQLKARMEAGGNLYPLKQNPPCFACGKMQDQHVNNQCLFAPTHFTMPTVEELYYYAVFGYFKGRHA